MAMKSLDLVAEEMKQKAAANELNLTPEEQQLKTQPEENGERLFTQEEVNQIVRERLARERAKNVPSQEDQLANELAAKELQLKQKQYLVEHDLPADEIMGVLDHFGIGTMDEFESTLDQILDLIPIIAMYAEKKRQTDAIETDTKKVYMEDLIQKVFKLGGRV